MADMTDLEAVEVLREATQGMVYIWGEGSEPWPEGNEPRRIAALAHLPSIREKLRAMEVLGRLAASQMWLATAPPGYQTLEGEPYTDYGARIDDQETTGPIGHGPTLAAAILAAAGEGE